MHVDEVSAAQHGIAVSHVAHALALAISGREVGLIHYQNSESLCRQSSNWTRRSGLRKALENIQLRGADGSMVSLRELVDRRAHHHRAQHLSQEPEVAWSM